LKKLQNLRIINLSGYHIEEVEIGISMKLLMELNLRGNRIRDIKIGSGVKGLKEIQFDNFAKMYLSNNQIKSFENVVSCKHMLANLTELTLENNPVEKDVNLKFILQEKFPALNQLTMSRILVASPPAPITKADTSMMNTLLSPRESSVERKVEAQYPTVVHAKNGNTATKRKAQENAVIKIIQKEWERETERLDSKKNGPYAKNPGQKNLGDKSLVQSGHAEIESNKILYIYGNALEVLARSEFYDVVEEMHLTYVRFDLIVYHPNLDKLRKFTKLKKLVLSHNYLNSFILLSKIECIHSLDQMFIYDNEILFAQCLKSFIVYRFQHITEFNGFLINE
jgi:Leucine-rich repeat (LRR) protein